jgi:hypothetical protein
MTATAGGCACTGTCGCFTGIAVSTPAPVANLPGLQAIAYRPGTHATFLASMLANLSLMADAGALTALRARDDGDLAIALLDAWAAVADVITFYSERIANENYLRTATERRSVLELARAVGYELSPGVAAGAYLAFTMQDATGAPPSTPLPAGTKVQSVPRPGQAPVMFETIEPIEARPAWNALRARQVTGQPVTGSGQLELVLAGTSTNLKAGDGLLFKGSHGHVRFGVVVSTATVPSPGGIPGQGTTVASVDALPGTQDVAGFPAPVPAALPAQVQKLAGKTITATDLAARAAKERFSVADLFACLEQSASGPQQVVVLPSRAPVFGNNAPAFTALPPNLTNYQQVYDSSGGGTWQAGPYQSRSTWTGQDLGSYSADNIKGGGHAPGQLVLLDSAYPQAAQGQYVVFRQGGTWTAASLEGVSDTSWADFTMSAKVTELTIDDAVDLSGFTIVGTTVYFGADLLALAPEPITRPVTGSHVLLNGWIDGLQTGQWVAVSGNRSDYPGAVAAEAAQLQQVRQVLDPDTGGTRLTLTPPLQFSYARTSMVINANVAPATHGETVPVQSLGSGDASTPFQALPLNNQAPLTYTSAASGSGAASTLSVQVSGVRWQETPYLYGQGPAEKVYVTRIADGGAVTVEGGDGAMGARFPTGQENIQAVYRKGTGLAGLVQAGQLTLLSSPVPGVRSVTNPLDAAGGADPEVLADARVNAPLSALTLGRIVSLQDYQDFARTFPGVAKALATWAADGPARGVMVTIAGPGGEQLPPSSQLYINLLAAMRSIGDPFVPLRLGSFTPASFTVSGLVKVDPARDPGDVLGSAAAALQSAFSFRARVFGQGVAVSQVLQVIHSVSGVLAVELTSLAKVGAAAGLPQGGLLVAVQPATSGSLASLQPAELLTIDPGPVKLKVM